MRGVMLIGAVALALTASAVAVTPDRNGKAKLRLVDPAPLTLRGSAFEPRERVRLRIELGERVVGRSLEATRAGVFTTTFSALAYNRCNGSLAVTATGGLGSRVSWELVPLECPAVARRSTHA